MKVIDAAIPGLRVLEPNVYRDSRGLFLESWNAQAYTTALGDVTFVQDNHSRSTKGVLRGLHYQIRHPQGKLVRVVRGAAFDVAIDLRRSSPHFGKWFGVELSEDNFRQLWIPPGFAHGFLALSEVVDFLYKTTDYYAPAHERCIRWDDPDIAIAWPAGLRIILSEKDRAGALLRDAEVFD
jgi:dTDP-4-dehydrorhamnose 3,5-epimerase